jgi:hypothetical protein
LIKLPFLQDIDTASIVSESARKAFDKIGPEAFIRSNYRRSQIPLSGDQPGASGRFND